MSGQELERYGAGGELVVAGASISAVGAEIAVNTPEEFETSLLQLLAIDTAIGQWALGDFVAYGREHFGDRVKDVLERVGESKRAKDAEKISRAFPREIRLRYLHAEMPFSYYRETAPLGTEKACEWLDKAIERGLSLADLRREIKSGATLDQAPAPVLRVEDADSQPNWIYPLGPHRLLCGDSGNPDLITALMNGEQAAMIWTDPPYGVAYTGTQRPSKTRANVEEHIANDELTDDALLTMLVGAWRAAQPHLVESAPVYAAGPSGINSREFIQSFIDAGWTFRQTLAWVKNRMVFGYQDYHYKHESIFYGYAPGPLKGRHAKVNARPTLWQGTDSETSVFECALPHVSKEHPTMKPIDLIKPAILNSSEPGDIVLDLYGGSGSTLIAAEETGRVCYIAELSPIYCDVIRQRYEDYIAAKPAAVIEGTATLLS